MSNEKVQIEDVVQQIFGEVAMQGSIIISSMAAIDSILDILVSKGVCTAEEFKEFAVKHKQKYEDAIAEEHAEELAEATTDVLGEDAIPSE